MSASIRAYEAADRAPVLALSHRLVADLPPWRDPSLHRLAIEASIAKVLDEAPQEDIAVLVAVEGTAVVGFTTVSMSHHFTGVRQASVDDLVVHASAEGQGVARALIAAAEAWAAQAGALVLTVETSAGNDRALALYRRSGLVDEDVRLSKPLRS